VDWGIEPILARLKEMDLHNRDVVGDLIRDYEKREQAKARHMRSENEAFFSHNHKRFARATSDINTALIKSDLNRSNKNGSRK
jgi:hypothetical protein